MIRIFKVFVPNRILFLLLSEAVLIFSCYVAATYLLYPVDATSFLLIDDGLVRISIGTLTVLLGLYFNDLYDNLRIESRMVLANQLCVTIGLSFLFQAVMSYVTRAWMMPRWLMILGSVFVGVAVFNWRLLYMTGVSQTLRSRSVVFLGCSPVAVEITKRLQDRPEIGLTAAGYIGDECVLDYNTNVLKRLGGLGDLESIMQSVRPARVVIAMEERRQRLPVNQLLDLRFRGLFVEEGAQLYEAIFGRICSRELRPSSLIFSGESGVQSRMLHFQTLYSGLIAAVAAIVTLPLMAIVAVAVKLSSNGPILFRQARVGMNDVPFMVYKFRSMHHNAEMGIGPVWATKDDPRITPVGRWLRRLRLDELPQLFNVLRGEMSICGPRPERPEFVKTLCEQIPFYRQRHCVRPGITGWAQINYKYGDTIEDTVVKLEFDLYYIKNLSPALDAYIMFHTMKTMLLSRGAQ